MLSTSPQDVYRSMNVVLLEGNRGMRPTLERILAASGRALDVVATPDEAIDRLDLSAVDVLVVSDTGGLDDAVRVLDHARRRYPETGRLLIAAAAEAGPRLPAASAIVHRVLHRPFQVESLQDAIATVEQISRHLREVADPFGDAEAQSAMLDACTSGGLLRYAAQPIVRADTQKVFALELLLRSTHPQLSHPLAVIEAAERSRKVCSLGRALNALAGDFAARLPPEPLLFVNVHPGQFADPDVVGSFAPLLPYAHRTVLEITERASLHDVDGVERAIAGLEACGFRVAVDDLGSGFNSLAVLAQLHPAFIKADMSIVRGAHLESRKQRLLHLLASFASATGAELVAEGVESEAEADAARRCGVHLLQGYLYGKPCVNTYQSAAL
jgi:EAL domain-containing protein (putative c-di-GMP-specific phosphodiesterase class I)